MEVTPQTDDKYYRRLGWIVLAIFVAIFGIWASYAPLSSAVPASGKVIVASKNQILQHIDGGIVKSILVNEGDSVKANQPLVQLDTTQSKMQLDIALAQYYQEMALESRLIAERDNAPVITFTSELLSMNDSMKKSMITEGQKREFDARKRQLTEEKNVYLQRIEQIRSQIVGLEATVQSKSDLSRSYKDEIQEWEILYKQQLIDKMRLRDIQREKVRIDGDIANAKADIVRSHAQISEYNAQILNAKQTFYKEVTSSLRDTQTKLADLQARIVSLQDILKRTVIRAPLEGIVTNMQVHTLGGVIVAGRPILEIVPSSQPMIVEAKVAINDAINVYQGLKAEIRFSSFAHIKSLDMVEGEVIYVAPDAVTDDQTHTSYYPVNVKITHKGKQELLKHHLVLQAGMPSDVMIIIKNRTFADYMIEPVKNVAQKAFNEQ